MVMFDFKKHHNDLKIDFYLIMLLLFRVIDICCIYFFFNTNLIIYMQIISLIWSIFSISRVSSLFTEQKEQTLSYFNLSVLLVISIISLGIVNNISAINYLQTIEIAAISFIFAQGIVIIISKQKGVMWLLYITIATLLTASTMNDSTSSTIYPAAILPGLIAPAFKYVFLICTFISLSLQVIIKKDRFSLVILISFIPLWLIKDAVTFAAMIFVVVAFAALIFFDFEKDEDNNKTVVMHSGITIIHFLVFMLC